MDMRAFVILLLFSAGVACADTTVPGEVAGQRTSSPPVVTAVLTDASLDASSHLSICHPELMLFENRRLFFVKHAAGRERYFEVDLTPAEYEQLLMLFRDESFLSLGKIAESPSPWVACVTHVSVRLGAEPRMVSTWGTFYLEACAVAGAHCDRSSAPATFLRVYDQIVSFDHPRARPWTPRTMTVGLRRDSGFKSRPTIPWPASWPKDDVKGNSWYAVVRLGAGHLAEIEQLARENRGLALDGRVYLLDRYSLDDPVVSD